MIWYEILFCTQKRRSTWTVVLALNVFEEEPGLWNFRLIFLFLFCTGKLHITMEWMFELSTRYQNPHLPLQFRISLNSDWHFFWWNKTNRIGKQGGGKYFLKAQIVKAKPFVSVYIETETLTVSLASLSSLWWPVTSGKRMQSCLELASHQTAWSQ